MTEDCSADEPLPESLLEDGLLALFRSPSEPPSSERSVLESIDARGAAAPRVLLREVSSGSVATALVDPAIRPDTGGHVQVLGEIARGGMGVVLKGRDPDLGRDLAMKVLREDLGERPEALQRFVEEAQIGGQLQHPGIVPVYGLGLLADGRPYFTMKLVRGRTLSELLVERASPAEDRPRFLAIFERLCQAVAYTHARGVVHRDLKPANVMIGAFGETQIVDWGLAKVLPRGGIADERAEAPPAQARIETVRNRPGSELDSRFGTVMGTPAYMPPEQALGLVDSLDERSDVFSLGAILCCILTGQPPYPGGPDVARRLAADADLDGAWSRLEECGADRELVELCRACLAPVKVDRPRSAVVLAERMSSYLSSVEERARAAQIAAAETRVRAREERKRLIGGAILLLLVVVLAAVGYGWLERQRRDRLAQTEAAVAQALEEATRLSGRAESTGDPAVWREALRATQAAQLVLEARESTPELSERVRVTLERVEREAEASRLRTERERRNRELLVELREIRVPEECWLYSVDWSEVAERYAAALAAADLSLAGLSVDQGARKLRESGIEVELAAALDEYAAARRAAGSTEAARRLTRIALLADGDADRRDLRQRIADGDSKSLIEFARRVDLEALPPDTLLLLANSLGHAGSPPEAVALLKEVNREHPDDFATTVQLARWLSKLESPSWGEIAALYRAALALRPDSAAVRHELGRSYQNLGALESALEIFEEGARRRPDDGHLAFHVGLILAGLERYPEAIEAYRESLLLEPESVDTRSNLGLMLKEVGELEESVEMLREAIEIDPDHYPARHNLGLVRRVRGEHEEASEAFREAIRIVPDQAVDHYLLGLELAEQGEIEGARSEFLEAVDLDPEHAWAWLNLGITRRNLGDPEGAITALRNSVRLEPETAFAWHILGRLLADHGELEEALEAYDRALELAPEAGKVHFDLGTDLLQADRYEEAAAALVEARRHRPGDPELLCNLGLALLRLPGRAEEALEFLREGHRIGSANPGWPYASESWIEIAEEAAAIEAGVGEFEATGALPAAAQPILRYAVAARELHRHAAAAELYARAFEEGGGDLDPAEFRLDALRSAATASDQTPDGPEARRMRELAIRWLKAEVEGIEATLDTAAPEERETARARLETLIVEPRLATLRDPRSLARLPVDRRETLLALWSRVRRRLASGE